MPKSLIDIFCKRIVMVGVVVYMATPNDSTSAKTVQTMTYHFFRSELTFAKTFSSILNASVFITKIVEL